MMSSKIQMKYNPKLSIEENALLCGVSVSTIRQFVKMEGIDRKYDNAIIRYRQIKSLQKKGLKPKEISEKVGCCLNTVKKYMRMEAFEQQPKEKKSSHYKLSNDNIIKSISFDQTEILLGIIRLYVNQGYFDADFTYSIGEFYSNGIVPNPTLKYDKFPQRDGVLPIEEAERIKDGTLKAVVVDLPFLITRREWTDNCRMNLRFNSFDNEDEAFSANRYMLDLSLRKLHRHGILVMKTMDVLHNGSQIWMSHFIINEAQRIGFKLIDMFILIAKSKMLNFGYEQKVARKYHSYFLVLKKQ
jgi:DNA-binding transcriptional MerR regulator